MSTNNKHTPNTRIFKGLHPQDFLGHNSWDHDFFQTALAKFEAALTSNTEMVPVVKVYIEGMVALTKQILDVICGDEELNIRFAVARGFKEIDFSDVLGELTEYFRQTYDLLDNSDVEGLVEIFGKATEVHAAFLEDFNVLMEEKIQFETDEKVLRDALVADYKQLQADLNSAEQEHGALCWPRVSIWAEAMNIHDTLEDLTQSLTFFRWLGLTSEELADRVCMKNQQRHFEERRREFDETIALLNKAS